MAVTETTSAVEMRSPNGQRQNDFGLFDNHMQLVSWVLKNGGYFHPSVEIAHSDMGGYHVIVAKGRTVTPQTRISSCPMSCTLSVLNILNVAPFSNRGTVFPQSFLDAYLDCPELLQTFFLMEQYVLGKESWWVPYIKTLPSIDDANQLHFDSPEDLQWIKGTNLEVGYRELMSKWKGYYNQGLSALRASGWSVEKCDSYSWELYRWAANMFGSRGFSSVVLSDTIPAEDARVGIKRTPSLRHLFSERFSVLLPLLDILNHRPKTKIDWQPRTSYVGLQIQETYTEGQEIYNNYGPKDNEGLLLSYGFVSEDKSFQHVALSLQPPPGTLLDITRQWPMDMRSNPERKLYILNAGHHKTKSAICVETTLFDYDLLDTISVLIANERESGAMFNRRKTLMSMGLAKPQKFDDLRNLLAVFGQLLVHCETGRTRLTSTRPNDEPVSIKQSNAKSLRDQQISHYEGASLLCRLVLAQACQHNGSKLAPSSLLPILGKGLSVHSQTNITILLTSHSRITRSEELFSSENILEMLPPTIKPNVKDLIHNFDSRIQTDASARLKVTTLQAQSQCRLAILLSIAHHTYTRGLPIPRRLVTWLKQITAWYQPDDPNWSFVPAEGPWPPGEEPPLALQWLLSASKDYLSNTVETDIQQWLKPNSLCWAYNVVYEENVVVPAGIAAFCRDEWHMGGGAQHELLGLGDIENGTELLEMETLLYMASQ